MQIELRGNADLRKALRRFAPDLEKSLKIEMKRGLAPVARAARGYVPSQSPLSGWSPRSFNEGSFPTYNAGIIKSKIGFSTAVTKRNPKGFSSMASVFNNSRAGAIYESAGRNGAQGQPWNEKERCRRIWRAISRVVLISIETWTISKGDQCLFLIRY